MDQRRRTNAVSVSGDHVIGHDNPIATFRQQSDKMGTDVAGSAGNENVHPTSLGRFSQWQFTNEETPEPRTAVPPRIVKFVTPKLAKSSRADVYMQFEGVRYSGT